MSAVIRFAKTNGKWIFVLISVGEGGEGVSQEVELESDQIESVTIELKDGTKKTIKPAKEAAKWHTSFGLSVVPSRRR